MKEETKMDIHELQARFAENRDYQTKDPNDLMAFAKKAYIHNEITFKEYRQLVRELENQGAVQLDQSEDSPLIESKN